MTWNHRRNLINFVKAAFKSLGTNVTFLLANVAKAMDNGFITFITAYIIKYIEEMFQISPDIAAVSCGAVVTVVKGYT